MRIRTGPERVKLILNAQTPSFSLAFPPSRIFPQTFVELSAWASPLIPLQSNSLPFHLTTLAFAS
uniref:Uncharacterized protein n=1 Tax=Anguilla anguilla TaxID=7936 RepID=A0A0E9S4F4_ANGAN